jgi:hypothetical protein
LSSSETPIPESHADIIEKQPFWHIATSGPDGDPQSSPVWVGQDENGNLCFSSLTNRQKYKNLVANPAISLSAIDPLNAYRYLEVRGTVVAIDDDPGGSYIDVMAHKYIGLDVFPGYDPDNDPNRVIIRVRPEYCTTMGT